MGFGHRVYKNYDPRAKIVRTVANQVMELVVVTEGRGMQKWQGFYAAESEND